MIGSTTKNVRLVVLNVDAQGQPTELGVKVYDTVVVTYHNDETFTTDSGGFHTPTTCSRITQFTPKWAYAHLSNRTLRLSGFYGDKNANRFRVDVPEVVGAYDPGPKTIRKTAKTPQGTLRWLIDDSGLIFSVNDRHANEMVGPVLDYEKIGEDGSYTQPLTYHLERLGVRLHDFYHLRGIAKSSVPLEIVNAHRKIWGMPEIVQTT